MLFTERKALEEMFNYLEEDKRTIKAQARQDIENIESRQMVLLDRLKRLDDVEREAVDVEGVLQQLATTTQQLSELIPNVPFSDVLEKVAEKIAQDPDKRAVVNNDTPKAIIREKIVEAARFQQVNSTPILKAASATPRRNKREYTKGFNKEKGAREIVTLLEKAGAPKKGSELEILFEAKTGIKYANFHGKLKEWREASQGRIVKEGQYYSLKEHVNNGEATEKTDHEHKHSEKTS